jgi:ADP-heptose:LPS heptosyltransferase
LKPEHIRTLDFRVGRLLCGLLTLHRRWFESAARREAARRPSRAILFIKLIEQGATVLAYDAISRATARVGPENVYFCVFAENREILDVMNVLPAGNVLVIRRSGPGVFLGDVIRALRRVRQLRIDTVIDLEFFARASAILAYLTGAPRRIGLHRFNEEAPYRGDLMTHRLLYNPFLHTARVYRLLVDALDADTDAVPMPKIPLGMDPQPPPPFVPGSAETQRLQALLEEAAGHRVAGPLVLLNPNCGDMLPLRRWPTERFVELGRHILAEHDDATVAITGAPAERAAAEAVCRAIASPRAINLAGRTTLRDMLVLYTLADVLVTNDSGPGHFASLTSIDSIVLFGPGAPSQFGPLGGHSHILWAGLACSPCANVYNQRLSTCTDNVCMQAIGVDAVYARVRACLTARRRQHLQAATSGGVPGLGRREARLVCGDA